jgi:prepilin peptidase CpaA
MDVSLGALTIEAGTAVLLLAGASADVHRRRIPNVLTFGGAAIGLVANVAIHGGQGAILSVSGWLLGAILLLVPFAMGGIGGGDVKLLAAAGAWGGPEYVFTMALLSAVIGGIIAIVLLIASGRLSETWRPAWLGALSWLAASIATVYPQASAWGFDSAAPMATPAGGRLRFPYGPALALGGIAALVIR